MRVAISRVLRITLLAFCLWEPRVWAGSVPSVVIVVPLESAGSEATADHLRGEMDAPPSIERLPVELEPGRLLERARSLWPSSTVVVLDTPSGRAWVLRPKDGTVFFRALEPDSSPASPYAVAVAAAELLRLAQQGPSVEPAPPDEQDDDEHLGLFTLGLGFAVAPGHEDARALPVFGADLGLRAGGFLGTAGLRLRGPTGGEALASRAPVTVDLQRVDLSIRFGFGPLWESVGILGLLEVGTSFTDVEAVTGTRMLRSHLQTPFWLGAGAEIDFFFWEHLAVSAGLQAVGVFAPSDYVVLDQAVLSEGGWRLQGQLGLAWVLR